MQVRLRRLERAAGVTERAEPRGAGHRCARVAAQVTWGSWNDTSDRFWAYVLKNPTGGFSIGYTDDLDCRVAEHNSPEKARTKHTHKNGPRRLPIVRRTGNREIDRRGPVGGAGANKRDLIVVEGTMFAARERARRSGS